MAEIIAAQLDEEFFEKLWKEQKNVMKQTSKKDLARQWYLTGIESGVHFLGTASMNGELQKQLEDLEKKMEKIEVM